MPRRLQHLQAHATEFDNSSIANRREMVGSLSFRAQVDLCARAIAQLQMPSHKVGVKMGQEYVLDLQSVFGSKREITINVPLRIDDSRRARRLVTDEIGSVRQATEIKLFKDHGDTPVPRGELCDPFGRQNSYGGRIFGCAAATLFVHGHQGRPGGSPFAIFLREHPQYPDFNLADFTVGALTFEASVIGGQRKISVDSH